MEGPLSFSLLPRQLAGFLLAEDLLSISGRLSFFCKLDTPILENSLLGGCSDPGLWKTDCVQGKEK